MIPAHTLTFPQVLASKVAVTTLSGYLIGGPDRKNESAGARWLAWQKDVQAAFREMKVPQGVMDYFQATKHLSAPPKEIVGGLVVTAENKEVLVCADLTVYNKPFKPPRFTWSYTSMQEFLTCPAQWAAKRFYKTIKDVESAAMRDGNITHETGEHYLKKALGLPANAGKISAAHLPPIKPYCDALLASGAELFVEKEMCFTKQFKPCGWRDWETVWVRGKGDVLAKKGNKLSILDWKTGKFKEDFLQLKLFAVLSALTPGFEDIQEFDPKFIFLKESGARAILRLPEPIKRSELKPVLAEILAVVRRMEEAWDSENFPCKKNGLCRNYCANTQCPHCGG